MALLRLGFLRCTRHPLGRTFRGVRVYKELDHGTMESRVNLVLFRITILG